MSLPFTLFVQDIMLRDLTVRQNIQFQADFRLPAELCREEREVMVDKVIKDLGLEHVQNQVSE